MGINAGLGIDTGQIVGATDNTNIGNVGDNLKNAIFDSAGNAINNGQQLSSNSVPVVQAADPTYSAAVASLVPLTSPTDILTIKGSNTKKINIKSIEFSGIQTTASVETISLIKRSTLNTNGGVGTIVQTQNSYTTANTTTATVTVTATGSGNLLIVGITTSTNVTVSSVSDGTNSFTQASGAAASSDGGVIRTDIWYLLSSTAGKTTITVTFSGTSTTKGIWFWEVSSTGTISFDTANRLNNGVIATTETGGAVTSTGADIIVGVIATTGSISHSPATGNTQFTNGGIQGSATSAAVWVQGGPNTYTPSWNDTGAGGAGTGFASSTAAFIASGNNNNTLTAVPHDSTQSAATGSVVTYFNNPTLGTAVGIVRAVKAWVPTTAGAPQMLTWPFQIAQARNIILNNANESLSINLGGVTIAGGNLSIDVEWTET